MLTTSLAVGARSKYGELGQGLSFATATYSWTLWKCKVDVLRRLSFISLLLVEMALVRTHTHTHASIHTHTHTQMPHTRTHTCLFLPCAAKT